MKQIIALFLFTWVYTMMHGQCSETSISVSASDTTYVQLYHAGFFLIPSGFANTCEWEVTTFSDEIVFQEATSGDAFEQGLVLFDHSVPISDSMKVTVVITNELEGIICTLSDTLFWEETEVLEDIFIGNWAILSDNGGVEEEITSVAELLRDEHQVELFPSLVNDYFQIEGIQDFYYATIFDLRGQVIQGQIGVHRNERVDVSGIPSGTYFVQIGSRDHLSLVVKKFIKSAL